MCADHESVAVVTGATSGIGRAIAICLAKSGTYVCLVGRSLSKLEALKGEDQTISSLFGCYQADLTIDNDLRKLSKRIERDFDKIDVLVHSAGLISISRIENSSIEDLDKQFSVNVRAPFYLTQSFLPLLKRSQGQIIFINSSVALRTAGAELSQYTMTKYALKALADSLRDEINSDGIRVITIYPGKTSTPMQNEIFNLQGRKYEPDKLLQPGDIAKTVMDILDLSRTSEVTDISIRPFIKPVR